jgi:hypothetical protein
MECAVGTSVIVEGQPGLEGLAAFGVGRIGPPVGPLLLEGAVEPLHLAIGLRPIGPGALEADAQVGGGLQEHLGVGVGLGVVGQHPLNGDPRPAKKLAASSRNRAAVGPASSSRIWLKATRERSSSSEWT